MIKDLTTSEGARGATLHRIWLVTPHSHARAGGYVIGAGVHIYIQYFSIKFSNLNTRTQLHVCSTMT